MNIRLFARQLEFFRAYMIDLEEYIESLRQYLLEINDVIQKTYGVKYSGFYREGKIERLKLRVCQYFCVDSSCIMVAETIKNRVVDRIFLNVAKSVGFHKLMEELNEAVIMKSKCHEDGEIK